MPPPFEKRPTTKSEGANTHWWHAWRRATWPTFLILGVSLISIRCVVASWEEAEERIAQLRAQQAHVSQQQGDQASGDATNVESTTTYKKFRFTLHHAALDLLYEVGIALLVFAFMSGTVERFAREAVFGEFKEIMTQLATWHLTRSQQLAGKVFDGVTGKLVGSKLGGAITELLRGPFMRTKWQLTFEFARVPLDGNLYDPDHLLLTVQNEYTLQNTTSSLQLYPIIHYFENVVMNEKFDDTVTLFRVVLGEKELCCLKEKDLATEDAKKIIKKKGIRTFVKRLVPVGSRQKLVVQFRHRSLRRLCDSDTCFTMQPSEGVNVNVIYPAELEGIQLWPDTNRQVEPPQSKDERADNGLHKTEWDFPEVFLPGQGIMLYWRVKKAETT
ncbi:MAG: hypothetical protein ACJ8C4_15670 [Gemmataceae bacterium]